MSYMKKCLKLCLLYLYSQYVTVLLSIMFTGPVEGKLTCNSYKIKMLAKVLQLPNNHQWNCCLFTHSFSLLFDIRYFKSKNHYGGERPALAKFMSQDMMVNYLVVQTLCDNFH
jgi:hypothetical protein